MHAMSKILIMLGQGESNADIVSTCASIRTVETYFSRMIVKLKLDGIKDLRRYAIRNNMQ